MKKLSWLWVVLIGTLFVCALPPGIWIAQRESESKKFESAQRFWVARLAPLVAEGASVEEVRHAFTVEGREPKESQASYGMRRSIYIEVPEVTIHGLYIRTLSPTVYFDKDNCAVAYRIGDERSEPNPWSPPDLK